MSKQPFFSIVIPTRNRPQLLKFALISLLKQSFTDFEVIVSDNSFPKDVREVFEKYSDDRFKYVRPEHELPMCNNWEFALSHAQGKYVTILEDKMFYYQEWLNNYYKVIQKESYPDIINTNEDSYILTNEELTILDDAYFKNEDLDYLTDTFELEEFLKDQIQNLK